MVVTCCVVVETEKILLFEWKGVVETFGWVGLGCIFLLRWLWYESGPGLPLVYDIQVVVTVAVAVDGQCTGVGWYHVEEASGPCRL